MERERRYPSDLTDAQWEIVEPMLPLIKEPGRIPKHPRRSIVDAVLYVVRSGCSWRQLPVDFPPWQTVYWQFQQWEERQVTERILEELREQLRLAEGRNREPSAGVMDSQSVKAADTVGRDSRGRDSRGYDAGKKMCLPVLDHLVAGSYRAEPGEGVVTEVDVLVGQHDRGAVGIGLEQYGPLLDLEVDAREVQHFVDVAGAAGHDVAATLVGASPAWAAGYIYHAPDGSYGFWDLSVSADWSGRAVEVPPSSALTEWLRKRATAVEPR